MSTATEQTILQCSTVEHDLEVLFILEMNKKTIHKKKDS